MAESFVMAGPESHVRLRPAHRVPFANGVTPLKRSRIRG